MRRSDNLGIVREDRLRHDRGIGIRERPDAREHLVYQHAERPDVAPLIDGAAFDVLGAHVRQRAEPALAGRRPVLRRRNPEIEDFHGTVSKHHDVGRLDVAVHDAARVGGADAACNLDGDPNGFLEGQPAPPQSRPHRLAVVQRHREEQLSVVGLSNLQDGADVRMIERGSRAGLHEKAFLRRGLCAEVRREKLQRDVTSKPFVVRLVDDPHPAGVHDLDDHVLADPVAFPSGDLRPGPGRRGCDRRRKTVEGS